MKKFSMITAFALLTVSGFCQQPANCPQVVFNYDASGNRIKRFLQIVPCSSQSGRLGDEPQAQEPAAPALNANVYPNPAHTQIYIELPEADLQGQIEVMLFDLSGRAISKVVTSSLKAEVNVRSLSSGTYLLRVSSGQKTSTYNVIKN